MYICSYEQSLILAGPSICVLLQTYMAKFNAY